ncbi:MAG: hypothetical protein A2527_10600 [Candidatus Lambdaproteobacteria bacterium RIFOXYD2_FULL_50_16]|uniref:Lipoprotein n=1 Tax=Candidatus Lambdaproteobacteria bacterium RIFOXYD2_FULL_50_16 TaxID=1817772 RepID=A0A1F6GGN2_9PROT|nr:MAG: hypothetical protein A2527_10600 [Candidatus Lambdaproteobacteria bacterium RIFOXYD2_FULL_50_16]
MNKLILILLTLFSFSLIGCVKIVNQSEPTPKNSSEESSTTQEEKAAPDCGAAGAAENADCKTPAK